MFVICYTDDSKSDYTLVQNLDTFRQNHPTATIRFMFTQENDIAEIMQNPSFVVWANMYGLHNISPMHRYKNERGENCVIIDIRPRNTKYPIIIYNEDQQKQYKCTAKSIKKQLGIDA